MRSSAVVALLVAGLLQLSGCGPRSALDDLRYAQLRPSEGLGDLRLGLTTMREFIERYGNAHVSGIFGDDVGVEFGFAREGMGFLFMFDGECGQQLRRMAARELIAMVRAHQQFFASYPECAATVLDSIDITSGRKPQSPWWQGTTPAGIGLNALTEELVAAHGEPGEAAFAILAGSSGPIDARYERLDFRSDGLVAWLLEAQSGPDQGRLQVHRLTLYRRD